MKFRSKEVKQYPFNQSHTIVFGDTREEKLAINDPYGASFYQNRILRESCYRCKYTLKERVSDITVADFGEKKQ